MATDPPFPDIERVLVEALKVVSPLTGTPSPKLKVVPGLIRVQRVPGGPGSTPWQDRPQVELVHYGDTRASAWELAGGTQALFESLNPAGGRLAGVFIDRAQRVADSVQTDDVNPDVRPVIVVWRFALRRQ